MTVSNMRTCPANNLPGNRLAAVARLVVVAGFLPLTACSEPPRDTRLATAERFVDAFYAFDSTRADSLLRTAEASRSQLLGYQAWAQGGNYTIEKRQPCRLDSTSDVVCAITVQDDIVRNLELKSWVTDTFRFTFAGDTLVKVKTSSNDPPQVDSAFRWVRTTYPELFGATGSCPDSTGTSKNPRECARSVMRAFREYRAKAK